ncbi:hypothetical protein [Actinacidiphila sp. ITFR-21]|nr:hypothetical protein [Streptomyces sp. ITFR-21]WNI14507.1 hypothetical protein RLT57_02430 [Streptomyces sp. ITFR-21]
MRTAARPGHTYGAGEGGGSTMVAARLPGKRLPGKRLPREAGRPM